MNSDDSTRTGPPAFRAMGVGYGGTFRCGGCDLPKSIGEGTGMSKVRGLLTRVCPACKAAIDARGKK